ncbi:MAG: hypothetical protein NTW59_00955 [Candidatus Diapherotrites archaeon]|nr:hypothetical protein [Candidatus Diapherotrites archaeon]
MARWFKKAVFGVMFTFFIFIFASMAGSAGMPVFGPEMLTLAGLMLLLGMGIFEINLVTYE